MRFLLVLFLLMTAGGAIGKYTNDNIMSLILLGLFMGTSGILLSFQKRGPKQ